MAIIERLKMETSQKKFGDKVGVTLTARETMLEAIDELEKYRKVIRLLDTGASFLNHLDCVM